MKKVLLTIGLILALSVPCLAGDGDFDYVVVNPDTPKACIDTIKILRFTRTAIITFRTGNDDCTGDFGEEFDVTFMDRDDDLSTLEVDETSTEFTEFYNYIHTRIRAGDSLKTAVDKACQIKGV